VAEARGQGIGCTLLGALIARARSDRVPQLSLSVEKDNPALKLYESAGFEIVGTVGNAWTMRVAT
jgi:ribosomal protein S18 acetylase RimI-like enzyme